MKISHVLTVTSVLLALSACSAESLKQTTYKTMQNVHDEECRRDRSRECPRGLTWEEYKQESAM